jgi:phosphoribosylamine--glycine ligase
LIEACTDGHASSARAIWSEDASACVVMASGGYPDAYDRGKVIHGIEAAEALEGVEVFHAGTSRDGEGRWVTAGGRVLGVTAKAPSVEDAVRLAYDATAKIEWDGVHYRKDIGYRAIGREKEQR